MRDLTAFLLAALRLLLPARGRRRLHAPATAIEPATAPPRREEFPHFKTSSWARYHGDRPHIVDAHGLTLVRPYFVAYEERAERQRQRERRIAAVLAPVGIDYDVALVAA